ncbi:MAG: hypothetical protein IRZ33_11940, partial [Alicyclobacillaceae bacterium]|nr:hypothetical protein [Alicyclobacillaceae bacterium]
PPASPGAGPSAGHRFNSALVDAIRRIAARDVRTFPVYVPTGGLPALKQPELELAGWASGSNTFELEIAEKGTLTPMYHLVEMAYDGPQPPPNSVVAVGSPTAPATRVLGRLHGVTVYAHQVDATTAQYWFRMGFTRFVLVVSDASGHRTAFPRGLLTHLKLLPSKGLDAPRGALRLDADTLAVPLPSADPRSGEHWVLTKDAGHLPAVQVRRSGKVLLMLSVPVINRHESTPVLLVAGVVYRAAHVTVDRSGRSGTLTLVRQAKPAGSGW